MIGVAGAHRVGKSTVAAAAANETGIFCLETRVSDTFARLGITPRSILSPEEYLNVQFEVLKDMEKKFAAAPRLFVSDRTPLDMAAYMMATIETGAITRHYGMAVSEYVVCCREMTDRYFENILLLQPGITIVDDPSKADCNPAYIDKINLLMVGLAISLDLDNASVVIAKKAITDLASRTAILNQLIKGAELRIATPTVLPAGLESVH